MPIYASDNASGADLRAAIDEPVILRPGERRTIPTGLRVELPSGYEGQVRARSGLAKNHGIGIINAPGTIDSDYRGEIQIILVNYGERSYTINPRDRTAQLVIAPVVRAVFKQVDQLSPSQRGNNGFGATGNQ